MEEDDLRRQMVRSEYASIEVPELELVIPARSQQGGSCLKFAIFPAHLKRIILKTVSEVTTIEGVLERVHSGLLQDQARRREQHPESAKKIDDFLVRLQKCMRLEEKWTLVKNRNKISSHSAFVNILELLSFSSINSKNPSRVFWRVWRKEMTQTRLWMKILLFLQGNKQVLRTAPRKL